jgi:CheY-specific phosphatase CheX
MPDNLDYNELVRRYGLEPISQSVLRLTKLVANQDSVLDEIVQVVADDRELTARLLRATRVESDGSETPQELVEAALRRGGTGCVLLLAMGAPLALALAKTCNTMLGLKLESIAPTAAQPLEGTHLLGTIGFSGKAVGRVHLRMSLGVAKAVASSILGTDIKEALDASEIDDAVGELLNIITGNLKSNLCDAGLPCVLEPPQVTRSINIYTDPVPGGGVERMAFKAQDLVLFVDVTVNPWSEE